MGTGAGVGRWFYRSEQELRAIWERLKRTPCPHCKAAGTLNRHGSLHGYDEGSSRQKTVRARRVFCSNRNARPGCGRTFSIWLVDKIRRLSVTAGRLHKFLTLVVAKGMSVAVRTIDSRLSDRTLQRIWARFKRGQSKIRTALSAQCPPPQLAAETPQTPAAQVLAHLETAFPKSTFPDADCPIAAYQHAMRTFFL
jgi:hypothetical protein